MKLKLTIAAIIVAVAIVAPVFTDPLIKKIYADDSTRYQECEIQWAAPLELPLGFSWDFVEEEFLKVNKLENVK